MAKNTNPTRTPKTKSASKSAASRKSRNAPTIDQTKRTSSRATATSCEPTDVLTTDCSLEADGSCDAKDPATAANPDTQLSDQENWLSSPNQVLEVPGTGKLGQIAVAVAQREGATMAELLVATGWQAHTIRAALSRLRKRGMPIILADRDGRKAYRVA